MSHDNLSFLDEFLHVVITGHITKQRTDYGDGHVLLSTVIFFIFYLCFVLANRFIFLFFSTLMSYAIRSKQNSTVL